MAKLVTFLKPWKLEHGSTQAEIGVRAVNEIIATTRAVVATAEAAESASLKATIVESQSTFFGSLISGGKGRRIAKARRAYSDAHTRFGREHEILVPRCLSKVKTLLHECNKLKKSFESVQMGFSKVLVDPLSWSSKSTHIRSDLGYSCKSPKNLWVSRAFSFTRANSTEVLMSRATTQVIKKALTNVINSRGSYHRTTSQGYECRNAQRTTNHGQSCDANHSKTRYSYSRLVVASGADVLDTRGVSDLDAATGLSDCFGNQHSRRTGQALGIYASSAGGSAQWYEYFTITAGVTTQSSALGRSKDKLLGICFAGENLKLGSSMVSHLISNIEQAQTSRIQVLALEQ
jgi:hypothetical protein